MNRYSVSIPRMAFALGLVAVAACAGSPEAEQEGRASAGTINGAGASFAMPIVTLWSSQYQPVWGDRVNYNSIGSGGGIRAHIDGTVDFAASEAPLNQEQTQRAAGTLTIPFTIGAVAIAFNLPDVTELRLSGDVLADIFLGVITHWNDRRLQDLNPGAALPDRRIVVVHRSDGSGTTYVFADYLSKISPRWRDEVGISTSLAWPTGIGGNGNEGVAGAISNNPYSIGYVELGYASNLGIPTATLKNRSGASISPSLEAATKAAAAAISQLPPSHQSWSGVSFTDALGEGSYPISSFSFFFVYEDLDRLDGMTAARAERIVRWIEWAVTEGQRYNTQVQQSPIPEALRQRNLSALDRIRFRGEKVRTW